MPITFDDTQRKALKSAGWLYLLMGMSAPIGLVFVPGKIIVSGDAVATAANIRSMESLLRIGIGTELFHQTIGIFLVLALYRLFKPVDEKLAKLLVTLGALVSVPIMFLNVLNEIAALMLVSGPGFLSSFEAHQLDALSYFFLHLHGQGIIVASVFWGLWLFPFGTLVIRSGFIPRILGFLLYAAGTAYLASAITTFLLPQFEHVVGQIALILEVGELPIMIWLFIKALKPPRIVHEGVHTQ